MGTKQELKELLQKYNEDRCSVEEEKLLQEWFNRIGKGQSSSGLSGDDRERMLNDFTHSTRFTGQQKPAKLRYLKNWRRVAVAAAMAGIVFCSWWLISNTKKHIVFVELQTGSGQIKQVVLPDSSVVWLNARTTLAYHPDFTTHREIRLSGEALFEVTRDEKHPFSVLTPDNLQTTVLGTQFNIRSYDRLRETQVTVVSGRVQVAQTHKTGVMGILTRNQAIRFDRKKGSYIQTDADVNALTGWRTGNWELKEQGVEELTLLLNNQYGITVLNRSEGVKDLHIDANFTNHQTAREIVTVFCVLAGCRHRWKDANTVELY